MGQMNRPPGSFRRNSSELRGRERERESRSAPWRSLSSFEGICLAEEEVSLAEPGAAGGCWKASGNNFGRCSFDRSPKTSAPPRGRFKMSSARLLHSQLAQIVVIVVGGVGDFGPRPAQLLLLRILPLGRPKRARAEPGRQRRRANNNNNRRSQPPPPRPNSAALSKQTPEPPPVRRPPRARAGQAESTWLRAEFIRSHRARGALGTSPRDRQTDRPTDGRTDGQRE